MKKHTIYHSATAILLGTALLFTGCSSQESATETKETTPKVETSTALIPKWSPKTQVTQNPYLSDKEAAIHNDIYNSDVTAQPMPLGIYTEVLEGTASDSAIAPPAFFYDNYGNAVAPYSQIMPNGSTLSGGIAIRDMNSEDITVHGKFLPYLDDNQAKYGIQISYSFVDKDNYLIGPATNGHVVMIRTYDENGNILPVFEKALDVDIVSGAVKAFGEDIDQNLLSIVYDYDGNLWFVTGGFHKNPAHSKAGFLGYLEREYIDKALTGEELDAEDYLHYMKLQDGENAENGIASHPEGCVILTNMACYMLDATPESSDAPVKVQWNVAYESAGTKSVPEGSEITGGGLAWGGGSSPTLTNELVLFTDNQKVINLIALDAKTGEEVARTPVLDLGEDVTVSVENSICVYAPDDTRAAVLVCNWYGAGNASLFDPNADSSIQSYDNLYDSNWLKYGSSRLMPGIERVDVVKQEDGTYKCEQIWCRDDLTDTCMIKYSSGAGYYYGYTQDSESGEWGFMALDFDTGETVLWIPTSTSAEYNNAAVGIMQGNTGNTVYCPTNSQVLTHIQDRFVYLPEQPDKSLDITKMERYLLTEETFQQMSGSDSTPATYLLSGTVHESQEEEIITFRVNGLDQARKFYTAYYQTVDGKLEVLDEYTITDESGRVIEDDEEMIPNAIYEIRVTITDNGTMDQNSDVGNIKTYVILAK